MRSRLPKVLHQAAGRTLVEHVLKAASPLKPARTVVVVGHGGDEVRRHLRSVNGGSAAESVEFVTQRFDTGYGTGHALLQAAEVLTDHRGMVLVLNGDGPLLRPDSLLALAETLGAEPGMALISCRFSDPSGLGRVTRAQDGAFAGIVEEKDATLDEREIDEVNVGVYLFDATVFGRAKALKPSGTTGEYYITELPRFYLEAGEKVMIHRVEDETEVLGVNDRRQLAIAESVLRERVRERWLAEGVTMLHPESTFIDDTVTLAADVVLEQGVALRGATSVGEGARVGAYSVIEDAQLPAGEQVPPHTVLTPKDAGN